VAAPAVPDPAESREWQIPRLLSFEGRLVEQEYRHPELPTRFWARCTDVLADDQLLHDAVLAYVSDFSSGVAPFNTDTHATRASLDHALWFHRPASADDWLLIDLIPQNVAQGRGWYRGSLYRRDGVLVASLAQETLVRPGVTPYFQHGV
jgi:acyl-CoA thioesterase-2